MVVFKGLLAVLCVAISCTLALADTLLTMRESYGDGEAAKEVLYWTGEGQAARIGADFTIVAKLDERKTYLINHSTRTYTLLSKRDPSPLSSAGSATLTRTNELDRIGPWNARKSTVRVSLFEVELEVEVWTSSEVNFDQSAYRAMIQAEVEHTGFEWMNVFLELDGFPVLQIASVGPIQIRQELVSVESKPAPAGTYSLPAGYVEE